MKITNQKLLRCCVSDTKSCITNNYPPPLHYQRKVKKKFCTFEIIVDVIKDTMLQLKLWQLHSWLIL